MIVTLQKRGFHSVHVIKAVSFDSPWLTHSYTTMTYNESVTNHPRGIGNVESFEKEGRLYKTTDDLSDGFNAL